mgnify:FL=1
MFVLDASCAGNIADAGKDLKGKGNKMPYYRILRCDLSVNGRGKSTIVKRHDKPIIVKAKTKDEAANEKRPWSLEKEWVKIERIKIPSLLEKIKGNINSWRIWMM